MGAGLRPARARILAPSREPGPEPEISTVAVISRLRAAAKDEALEQLAARAASLLGLEAEAIRDALAARERLGSTSLGRGIAMPHARLNSVGDAFLLFARLDRPVEFGGDDPPVDLIFLLLVPQSACGEYLQTLAGLAKALRDSDLVQRLRHAADEAEITRLIAGVAPAASLVRPLPRRVDAGFGR